MPLILEVIFSPVEKISVCDTNPKYTFSSILYYNLDIKKHEIKQK